ncbi:Ff.00g068240.m01.CDS01 [Fusarium sp. VM40]|nr:Ff.00g068240.m01.CDS01 [Fusarium sp. VM40]
MRRLGRCDPTVDILVRLYRIEIEFFESAKRDPDFRMFLKRVVGIKGNVPSCLALKRTQDWACDAMYFLKKEERKKSGEEESVSDDALGEKDAETKVEPKVEPKAQAGPVFEGDNLIAF